VDFVVGDIVRQGFGFANPNHAAAAICALFPFCWGWRGRWRWSGWFAAVVLCAMLAMTYSRMGMLVLLGEAVEMWFLAMKKSRNQENSPRAATQTLKQPNTQTLLFGLIIVLADLLLALWWMWPRLTLDGAILNRPRIWFAGLRLFAANPLGVGFGKSGEIATAFMLPDAITVRTLVNSHLTLLAEMGAFVGGAWLAFIALALCVGRKLRRTWVAFAGLAVSAFSASVFDWHVLFDFAGKGGYGVVNFALAWVLFVAFVVMGGAMVVCGVGDVLTRRRGVAENGRVPGAFAKLVGLSAGGVAVALCAVVWGFRSDATPRVEEAFARVGNGGAAVYRGEGWGIRSVREFFPDGARFCLAAGVPEVATDGGEVWLFGDAAESAWRFPASRLTLVSPPEFCDIPTNAVVVKCFFRQD